MKTNNLRFVASLVFAAVTSFISTTYAQNTILPFKNTKLPIERRVDDLVSRMTLDEKISQMQNGAPAIPRLGIAEYDWWNEALHGVARAGIATVFPQAIGMAATFDEKLILNSADIISTEARAKHNDAIKNADYGRYKGLTFWSPNINIFRDPRWGRGQETWGEDPYLTGKLGTAFVRGLQGDDPKYLKVAATVKHFAVHSGPESERHSFDAVVSERDLRETYLPAFRTTILDGRALGVMCAYNRFDGLPACANSRLLVDILRGEWKFSGHVVSDCGAIDDIYLRHKFLKTVSEASALAVKTGTDLTCGREYKSLADAVKNGLISEKEIDTAVAHLMKIRFQLGMFDPTEAVKYGQIPITNNDTPANHQMALTAARESLVLLKNDGILPLSKNTKTIAVIGPNADDKDVLLGNYNGKPSEWVTVLDGIRKKAPDTKILYSAGMYQTGSNFEAIPAEAFSSQGLRAEYYNNQSLSGEPAVVRKDAQINFNWSNTQPPKPLSDKSFSIRWTGKITATETGNYDFGWRGRGFVKIFLDGKIVLEESKNLKTSKLSTKVDFVAGKTYDLVVEYIENKSDSSASRLTWSLPSAEKTYQQNAVKIAGQADVTVLVMGINPAVEGEEMDVKIDGFSRGDRTDIALPKPQEDLIKAIQAIGKPVVLVTMGGSALALNWENEHLSGILHAWYPGQFGGSAIADVLFGDYNPAGRLPVTFYKSVNDLPPFDDYKMEGRTYRYFRGTPLYPFGYGLSFSRFEYSNLRVGETVKTGQNVIVTADLQNVSNIAGDEVVQLYLSNLRSRVPVPIRSLVGFKRINLQPSQKITVSFRIDARQMSIVEDNGKRVIEPSDFEVSIGGKQPGFSGSADAETTGVVKGKFRLIGRDLEIAP